MKIIYLAAPYSHSDKKICKARVKAVTQMAANLIEKGYIVYSPITHSHPISLFMKNSLDGDFWLEQNKPFFNVCDIMAILMLDGWVESYGIMRELKWALELKKKIVHLDPRDCSLENMPCKE